MAFIHTPNASASEKTTSMYASAEANYGYLPNMYRAFGHRPEVMESWAALLSSIRGHMSLRRYELVTLAAAKELKSSYCMLAHGSVLLREGFTSDGLTAVVNETERRLSMPASALSWPLPPRWRAMRHRSRSRI